LILGEFAKLRKRLLISSPIVELMQFLLFKLIIRWHWFSPALSMQDSLWGYVVRWTPT